MLYSLLFLLIMGGEIICQLLLSKKDIEVPIGREVFLKTIDLQFYNVALDEVCKVEVVPNEPMSQRVGLLDPQVFDCAFKYGTVKYSHHGSPLLMNDTVKLRVFKFLKKDTLSEFFDLNFIIKNVTYNVIQFLRPLVVTEFFGFTEPIDNTIVNFNFSRDEGAICKARLSRYLSNRPSHGQIVIGREKRPVDVIKRRCDDFLQLGLLYKHLRPPTPNIDFVLIVIEVSDPFLNNGELVMEWFQIPVKIQPGFPNLPPKASFSGMYLMDVDQFIITTITSAVLAATDSETPSEQLIFNISRPLLSNQGSLVHLSDHSRPITSFRQVDLNNFDIAYKPPTKSFKERQMFDVGFTIFDADFLFSEPFTLYIAIRPSVTKAPRVSMNAGMVLLEGQSRPLRLKNLEIVDTDNLDDVQIFVTGGLHHGKLEVGNRPAVSFTQRNIEAGLVVYHHDDSDSVKDSIHLRIYDGSHSTHIKFPITIIPKDDNPPNLIANLGLKVEEGQTVIITSDVLRAVDHDTSEEHIIFIVKKVPVTGTVRKKFTWEKDGNIVKEFTQRDVNKGLIYYQHNGNEIFIDSIEIVVQDSQDPPNISPSYIILIRITPVGDDPPKRDSASSFSLAVREIDIGVLSSKHLRYMDADSTDREVIYIITEQPRFIGSFALSDPGKIVSVADQVILTKDLHLPSISNFTQEEVNHHKIAYVPPLDDIGPNPLYLQCVFAVTDKHKNTVTGQVLNITLLPVNNQIPQLHTGRLFVEEGASTLLSTNELSVYDPDTLQTDLQMSLFTIPLHGSLRRSSQPLRVGDLLSLDDILTLRLEYVHDGSESFKDSFKVGINDGLHFVAGEVLIEIEPVDDEIPIWLPGISQQVFVNETGSAKLTSQVLAATDVDTNDESLFFILTKAPQFGYIAMDNRKVNKFNQREIMHGEVKYVHNGQEIGPKVKEDTIIFIVTDKAFPRLTSHPSHKLIVTILPQNTQRPKISFKRAILVTEGLRTAVTEDNLSVIDDDTLPSELTIIVKSPPQFGYLENMRPTPGFEVSNRGKRTNVFSMRDIKNGFVVYSQSIHKGIEPESDSFEVFATDGLHNSSSILLLVSIILQNDEEPIFELSNITVSEGGVFTIDSKVVSVSDRDFPGDVLIIGVKSKPAHGTLTHMVKAIQNGPIVEVPFKEVTIQNFKHVVYKHDDSETLTDSFSLILSDGVHKVSRKCYVDITPVNDESPHLVKNIGARNVEREGYSILSSGVLLIEDLDTVPEELIFKVLTSVQCGILQKKVNDSKDSNEWKVLEPLRFSQNDVNLNLIRYMHNITSPFCYEDNFTFVVTDGVHESSPAVFEVQLVDVGKTNFTVIVSNAVVEENESLVFNSSMLQAYDGTSNVEDIVFHILKPPELGTLSMVSNSAVSIESFSLVELMNEQVMYKHHGSSREPLENIELMATNGVIQKNVTFPININIKNIPQPEFPTLDVLSSLHVDLSDINTVIITTNHLSSSDPSVSAVDVIYSVIQKPLYGTLHSSSKQSIVGSFSQEEINKNSIFYQSNRTGPDFADKFSFTVSNGKSNGYYFAGVLLHESTEFQIHVKPKLSVTEPLVIIASPDQMESVWNGHLGYVLHNRYLQASFPGSSTSALRFYVVRYLQHGYIFNVFTEKVVRTFTQEDIDRNHIVVILKQVSEVRDFFTFNVAVEQVTYNHEHRMDFYWAAVYFSQSEYFVCEDARVLNISVHRNGNLNVSSYVGISAISQTAREGLDYIPARSRKIQFESGSSSAFWHMIIIQDHLEEAPIEQAQIVLYQPENCVIGSHNQTLVSIYDLNRGACSQIPAAAVINRPEKIDEAIMSKGSTKDIESDEENDDLDEESDNSSPYSSLVCDQHIYGLLQYNHTTGSLFECNGKEWTPWNPSPTKRPPTVQEFYEITATESKSDDEVKTNTPTYLRTYISTTPMTTPSYLYTIQPCLEGWHLFDGSCHKFHRQQSTWSSAQTICRSYSNSHLVMVKSSEHNEWLVQLARSKPFWIGLHALTPANKWSYESSSDIPYLNWKKGFPRLPSSGEMKHKCVLVRGSGFWINRHCEYHEHSFVCALPAEDQT